MLTTNQLFFLGGPSWCKALVRTLNVMLWWAEKVGPLDRWTVGPGMSRDSRVILGSHGKSMVAMGHPKILGEAHFPNYTSIENDIDYL